jgi:hypothetical protein
LGIKNQESGIRIGISNEKSGIGNRESEIEENNSDLFGPLINGILYGGTHCSIHLVQQKNIFEYTRDVAVRKFRWVRRCPRVHRI